MSGAAVFFFEEAGDTLPMTLQPVRGRPVLYWTVRRLCALGTGAFFAAAPPERETAARACFPPDAALTVSDLRTDLLDFLRTHERVTVFSRAALPMKAAGIGFVYAASGPALAEAWRERLTNAVQDTEPVSGWVPVYNRDILAELEPLFDPESETGGVPS